MSHRENLSSMPFFTQEDEEKEISNLTNDEIVSLMNDLMGRTSMDGDEDSFQNNNNNKTIHILLAKMRLLIKRIPEGHSKHVLLEAQMKCPNEFCNEKLILFLKREAYNPALAVKRLVEYWKERYSLFGDEYCFLPMTQNQALARDHEALKQGYLSIPFVESNNNEDDDESDSSDGGNSSSSSSANTSASTSTSASAAAISTMDNLLTDDMGRPVMILDSSKHSNGGNNDYTIQQMLRVCWYMFELLIQIDMDQQAKTTKHQNSNNSNCSSLHNNNNNNHMMQQPQPQPQPLISDKGIVLIVNPGNNSLLTFDRKLEKSLYNLENSILPIEIKVTHLAKDDVGFNTIIKPIIFKFLSKRQRLRFRVHKTNNQEEKFVSLERYGIPRSLIPSTMIYGGTLTNFDYLNWLYKQKLYELEQYHHHNDVNENEQLNYKNYYR